MAFLKRFRTWLWQFLICLDQLSQVWLAGWIYVWLGRGACPQADETVSSRVGKAAREGKRWGRTCSALIDWLFRWLTGERDHCANAIEEDEGLARRPSSR